MQERASLHAAFGSYVDPALAERALAQGDSLFAGEDVEATVMFVDVRGFTPLSERIGAGETVALLHRIFGLIVPISAALAATPTAISATVCWLSSASPIP